MDKCCICEETVVKTEKQMLLVGRGGIQIADPTNLGCGFKSFEPSVAAKH